MTNERSIELLKRISDSQFDGPHGDERREALEMAVRALEQNLVQESGGLVKDLVKDCISRQQAIDAVKDLPNCRNGFSGTYDKACIIGVLEDLPVTQPHRKKGKWIKLDMHAHLADHKCTACGQECYVPTCMGEPMYIYCPNCGSYNGGENDG